MDLLMFEDKLKKSFIMSLFVQDVKNQDAYLSPADTDISFDECKHIYMLDRFNEKFGISVTGFCKEMIHHNGFDMIKTIRNIKIDEDTDDYYNTKIDIHAQKLIEWKYASVFGSLFHAIVEYFFNNVVNNCTHHECRNQTYNIAKYTQCLIDASNNYNLSLGIQSQVFAPIKCLAEQPLMPCIYSLELYDIFVRVITDKDNFVKFLKNNYRYNMDNSMYIKDIINTMEQAFECVKSNDLKPYTRKYRNLMINEPFEFSVERIIFEQFNIDRYLDDLICHLKSFKNVLMHLPLGECCDIRPEYIVYSREHGVAGSVDLTMRKRFEPNNLLIYDWKTCKKIFNSFSRNKEQTNQLLDYSCQLHTYANIIKDRDSIYNIDLFVVNVTASDSCIYNVRKFTSCGCMFIFADFFKKMINI